jgi:hypothetical protein
MEKFSLANKEALQSAQVELEEVRAGMNADLTEHLAASERHDEGHFWKQRRSYEKKNVREANRCGHAVSCRLSNPNEMGAFRKTSTAT